MADVGSAESEVVVEGSAVVDGIVVVVGSEEDEVDVVEGEVLEVDVLGVSVVVAGGADDVDSSINGVGDGVVDAGSVLVVVGAAVGVDVVVDGKDDVVVIGSEEVVVEGAVLEVVELGMSVVVAGGADDEVSSISGVGDGVVDTGDACSVLAVVGAIVDIDIVVDGEDDVVVGATVDEEVIAVVSITVDEILVGDRELQSSLLQQ